jgi:hypothetical protein
MTSINTSRNVGIEDSIINVGQGLELTADVASTDEARDTVDGSGDAEAIAVTEAQVAVLGSPITVGEAASLLATETGELLARAETTSGSSYARAANEGATGGYLAGALGEGGTGDITIGTFGTISATVGNGAGAEAISVAGPARAEADTGRVAGFGDVNIYAGDGPAANLRALVEGTMEASATAVGLPTEAERGDVSALAGSEGSELVGIRSSQAGDGAGRSIAFGRGGSILSQAEGSLTAASETVTGSAEAASVADLVAGIASDSRGGFGNGAGLAISIGDGGSLTATGVVRATATAETVTGPALSKVEIDTIGGLIDRRVIAEEIGVNSDGSGSSLAIGRGGTVEAQAIGTGRAVASAVTAPVPGGVVAEVNNDNVVGIALDKLTIGTTGGLLVNAASTQEAVARATSAGADPTAAVAEDDAVIGLLRTPVRVGLDLQVKGGSEADVAARLSGRATASAVSSGEPVLASAGEGSQVAGLREGELAIGANIGTGRSSFKVLADSALTATSDVISGDAVARSGSEDSIVVGLDSLPISVGQSGSILTNARGSVASSAVATTGAAEAYATQTARGLQDTTISIGANGSVVANARLVGAASAETVTGDATAAVELTTEGIDQLTTAISVGQVGDVVARAVSDGDASAVAVTGAVNAASSQIVRGANLSDESTIAIGEEGDVIGSADMGTALLTADTVTGDATASGSFLVAGLDGEDGAWIKAGPKGGDISGTARGAGDLLANTVSGDAVAETSADLVGIRSIDLLGGLVGANQITASAEGDYLTTSTAVTGDADAFSDVTVGGLIGEGNTASLSGSIEAMASLVNSVFASTVTGSATAIASGDVVGISGYDIHILGSGSIKASVNSETATIASSVTA